jgi:hypothetical protein
VRRDDPVDEGAGVPVPLRPLHRLFGDERPQAGPGVGLVLERQDVHGPTVFGETRCDERRHGRQLSAAHGHRDQG